MPRDSRLTADENRLLTKLMLLGPQTALPIELLGTELSKLIGIIYRDTENTQRLPENIRNVIVPNQNYYDIDFEWFEDTTNMNGIDYINLFLDGKRDIPDFITYLRCLSELHKRRKKYAKILVAQPIPTMVQVSPRSLLEYGGLQVDALASWITWRKWFFDIDNRSAQESGYLFEPILASALGGEPASGRNSPILRTGEQNKRRQVDCVLIRPDGARVAYEFKLRVTIAASGQGRFGEEVGFANDCINSGYRPILIVLDPTPNHRLADLENAFRESGGEAYVGDAAWEHLEQEAGNTMANFIERYVREPIRQVSNYENHLLDFAAKRHEDGNIEIKLGEIVKLIERCEDDSVSDTDEDE
ncbi:hypothetical protein MJO47_03210 [Desulfuromonas sp. KJ2020]|uniref:hypothetical protein n=1 Tax=Desulfuromonas sp. KJ2020 TaxID=2919173 RepID=UPI0020A7C7E6|nr:hypothetical protein [Desulfuromonas sp. KJ2020]MCP3176101.1 hypothetical protein [Desulfuromonas sp. KJ2020]